MPTYKNKQKTKNYYSLKCDLFSFTRIRVYLPSLLQHSCALLGVIRRALRTPHAQILREIVFHAQGLEAILDLLEHAAALLVAPRPPADAPSGALALALCAACTRVLVIFVADPAVRSALDEPALNLSLLRGLFGAGAPPTHVWRLVLELLVFARVDDDFRCDSE